MNLNPFFLRGLKINNDMNLCVLFTIHLSVHLWYFGFETF